MLLYKQAFARLEKPGDTSTRSKARLSKASNYSV